MNTPAGNEPSQPLAVPLSDQLGPLPEPAAWNVYWRGDNDGPSWDQWHDESDPLPKAWEDTPPDDVTPYYTAEQVRAYAAAAVAAERERCITAAEDAYIAGKGAKGCIDAIRVLCGPNAELTGRHAPNSPAA